MEWLQTVTVEINKGFDRVIKLTFDYFRGGLSTLQICALGTMLSMVTVFIQHAPNILAIIYEKYPLTTYDSGVWRADLSALPVGHYYVSAGLVHGECDLVLDGALIGTTRSADIGRLSALTLSGEIVKERSSQGPEVRLVCSGPQSALRRFEMFPTVLEVRTGKLVELWRNWVSIVLGPVSAFALFISLLFSRSIFKSFEDYWKYAFLFSAVSVIYSIMLPGTLRLFLPAPQAVTIFMLLRMMFSWSLVRLIESFSGKKRKSTPIIHTAIGILIVLAGLFAPEKVSIPVYYWGVLLPFVVLNVIASLDLLNNRSTITGGDALAVLSTSWAISNLIVIIGMTFSMPPSLSPALIFVTACFMFGVHQYQRMQAGRELAVAQAEGLSAKRVAELAEQVAHDIRSPLAAIEAAMKTTFVEGDDAQKILRSAVARVRDIATNLDTRSLSRNRDADSVLQAEFLSPLIEEVVSEKRTQYRDTPEFEISTIAEAPLSATVRVNGPNFMRMLSNLIDNAIQALVDRGKVLVSLSTDSQTVCLEISDNGKGIPESHLERVGTKGFTFGKEKGSGLGVFSAKKFVESLGGSVQIISRQNVGTRIRLSFPRACSIFPLISKLSLSSGGRLIVLDGDPSIHALWESKASSLAEFKDVSIVPLGSLTAFETWIETNGVHESDLFLIDSNFSLDQKYGINLIQKFNLLGQSVLVTSGASDLDCRNKCFQMNLRLLPKQLLWSVPVDVVTEQSQNHQPDAVLISEDVFLHSEWRGRALVGGRQLETYFEGQYFLSIANKYSRKTAIYIDSSFGDKKSAELAKKIQSIGFDLTYLVLRKDGDQPPSFWNGLVASSSSPWGAASGWGEFGT